MVPPELLLAAARTSADKYPVAPVSLLRDDGQLGVGTSNMVYFIHRRIILAGQAGSVCALPGVSLG
jgi:hypothetical protein